MRARSLTSTVRYRAAGLAAFLCVLLALTGFFVALNHEERRDRNEQQRAISALKSSLQQALALSTARLEGLTADGAPPRISALNPQPGEVLLAWAPREMPTATADSIFEIDTAGQRIPATQRPDFHPLREIAPAERGMLKGLELTSLPGAVDALLRARSSGALAVSEPVRLPPSFGVGGPVCLALVPVHGAEESGAERPERGMLVAVLDLAKVLETHTAQLRADGAWRIALTSQSDGSEIWASTTAGESSNSAATVAVAAWGGRMWTFSVAPAGTGTGGVASSTLLLILGLLFSGAVAWAAGCVAGNRINERLNMQAQTQELSREISSRLNTEAALRERQEAFQDLFENSSDLILIFSVEGKVLLSNPACTQVLGFSALELKGLLFEALLEAGSRAAFDALLKNVVATGKAQPLRLQFRARGGRRVLLEGEVSASRPGAATYYRAILSDITEKQRIEDELRRSQDSLAALVENTEDAIWSVDGACRLQSFNAPFADLHQEAAGTPVAVGMEHLALLDAENRVAWSQLYERALKGERLTVERAERLGGVARTYLISMNPIVSSGVVTGVTVFRKDITEQKKLDNALRALVEDSVRLSGAAFFKVLAQHLASALSVSRAFVGDICRGDDGPTNVRLLGFFPEAAQGNGPKAFEVTNSVLEEVAAKGSVHIPFGVRRLFPEDPLLRATMAEGYCAVALKGGDGVMLGVLGAIHDEPLNVTPDTYTVLRIFAARASAEIQRSNAEAALALARDTAIESARLKTEFLANMSHEIRTPINGVIGMTELLESTPLPRDAQRYLGNIRSCSDVLLTLIDDILDFSKIEAGKLIIECVDFNLPRAVGDCVGLFRKAAEARGIRLEADVGGDVPAMIRGDTVRIRQVLSNLISNAVKFTQAGGVRVTIETLEATDSHATLRFSVKDTGIGIPEEAQARLFKPFVQADGSTTRRFGGSGLGLSICKRLIELMGGEIGVESRVGAGSEFWFSLRLERSAKSDSNATMAFSQRPESRLFQRLEEPAPALATRAHVLLVEDNPINQEVAKALLERLGCRVTLAPNGQDGLERLKKDTFDVVFMDCQMPVLDGYEATAAIRRHEAVSGAARARIVAMTAHALPTERERCLASGMDDYVAKPITRAILRQLLERWVPRPDGTPVDAAKAAVTAVCESSDGDAGEEPALDMRRLLDAGGDAAGMKRLADLSLAQLKGRLENVRRAQSAGNMREINRIAHMGVGSCGACGMFRLANHWRKLEALSVSGGEGMAPLIAEIESELKWVESEITAHLARG